MLAVHDLRVTYPGLSGGQRRLVLLAMALACDPEVLILDEPASGLDPVTRERVLSLLDHLRQAGNTAMVILGHDADALELVASHVAVLYRGWLADTGRRRPCSASLGTPTPGDSSTPGPRWHRSKTYAASGETHPTQRRSPSDARSWVAAPNRSPSAPMAAHRW